MSNNTTTILITLILTVGLVLIVQSCVDKNTNNPVVSDSALRLKCIEEGGIPLSVNYQVTCAYSKKGTSNE